MMVLCFAAVTAGAQAAMTRDDLVIAARALGFLENPPTGVTRVGIVYAAGMPRSVQQANDLQTMLAGGLKVGNLTMVPVKVKTDDVAAANVGLFLLTDSIGGDGTRVSSATKAKHIPCITTDLSAVENGTCAVGVRSIPRIEIVVNRVAAVASGTSFATVFRMLITEI